MSETQEAGCSRGWRTVRRLPRVATVTSVMLIAACTFGEAPGERAADSMATIDTTSTGRAVAPDGVMPWRIHTVTRIDDQGVPRSERYVYDTIGNLLRVEQRALDRTERTVVYALAADGRMHTRVDIEPDDLDRFLYRYRDRSNIRMRLRDGDADGRFGSYLLFRFDAENRARAAEHYDIEQDVETVTAGDGVLEWRLEFIYDAEGRVVEERRDEDADGDVDQILTHTYDNLGRIASSEERRDGATIQTRRYTFQRGPCRVEQFTPSRRHYCVR